MNLAINMAKFAYMRNEVPVGAIVVNCDNDMVTKGYNQKNSSKLITKHAEIIAIERMCKEIGDWRLSNCVLYVTLEPCLLCIGAIIESRIKKVVIGCNNSHNQDLIGILRKNNIEVVENVLSNECSMILKDFFKAKRK